ncbi:MAG: FAD-dependent oxidoreductase [Spirochaetota bacterium]
MSRTVIAGFGSAGYAALVTIKRNNPKAEIIIVDPKEHDLTHPCGLPYALENKVPEHELQQNINLPRMGVEKISAYATGINVDEKKLIYSDGTREGALSYDNLLICTGSVPFVPPIDGVSSFLNNGVYTLTSIAGLRQIKEAAGGATRAVVIGAGAIGLECALALKILGVNTTVIEMRKNVLPGVLDPDMAKVVELYLEKTGIDLVTGTTVDAIEGSDRVSRVIAGDLRVDTNMVVLASGFRPNTTWLEGLPVKMDRMGNIQVNDLLETGLPGVYAAGDCILSWSRIDREPVGAKLATSAYKQGIAAGTSLSGGKGEYLGTAGTFVTKIGQLEVAGTGFTMETARERGFLPVQGKITSYVLPDYYPGGNDITVKIICDNDSGAVLGGQAIGISGAAERVNIISMAIEYGTGVDNLARLEMAYCPPVSEVHDPLMRAVEFAMRRRK